MHNTKRAERRTCSQAASEFGPLHHCILPLKTQPRVSPSHAIIKCIYEDEKEPHLVSPFQHVLLSIFDLIVDVEELQDAVLSNVVRMFLGLFPVER